ncbi:unnamed protein product, partial [Meganyctiphanes norvegica]
VHVAAGTDTSSLAPIQNVVNSRLVLSQLQDPDHLPWAVRTAATLQPPSGYDDLVFPSCRLTPAQLCQLLEDLNGAGVRVEEEIMVSAAAAATTDKKLVEDALTRSGLECKGGLLWFQDDDELSSFQGGYYW